MGAAMAQTDGTAKFRVRTVTANGQYAPRHVLAIWVTDARTNFVKTLKKQAAARQQYLNRWRTSSGGYTQVDGISGPTLPSHQTHEVTWDCRNTAGAVVPDGLYRFFVEFTEINGQGPWTGTNMIAFSKGPVALTNQLPGLRNFVDLRIVFVPAPPDIGIVAIAPAYGAPDTLLDLAVLVTNRTAQATTTQVALENMAGPAFLGIQPVFLPAGPASATAVFPWNTAGLEPGRYPLRATIDLQPGETNGQDNVLQQDVILRHPIHDLALETLQTPGLAIPQTTTNLTLTLANLGDFPEDAWIWVSDDTVSRMIASNHVLALGTQASRRVNLNWTVPGDLVGTHQLRAWIDPLPGETVLSNNTAEAWVTVATGFETNVLLSPKSRWLYEDSGLDLSQSPWRELAYYDGHWASGLAPLGYGDTHIVSPLNYGTNASQKRITCYFRHRFIVDSQPTTAWLRLMCDDGAVVYLNGTEVARQNMPAEPVTYRTLANQAISGSAETNYTRIDLDSARLVMGSNQLAVEVHQNSASSSDFGFDLSVQVTRPSLPRVPAIQLTSVTPLETASAADLHAFTVAITNAGQAVGSFPVFLRDLSSGRILATNMVENLMPGQSTTVELEWLTAGVSLGDHSLAIEAVLPRQTNSWAFTTAVSDSGTDNRTPGITGSLGGRCVRTCPSGELLMVAQGATMTVFSRTNPVVPTALGALRLPAVIEHIAESNAFVYAACGQAGVAILSVANPTKPVYLATLKSAGHAYATAINGPYLYVADGRAGVRIWDVTHAQSPRFAGLCRTDGPVRGIDIRNGILFALDAHKGLILADLSDPVQPVRKGLYPIDAGIALALREPFAYLLDEHGQLDCVGISPLATPRLAGRLTLGAPGRSLCAEGNRLYVAAGSEGLLTVNVEDPTRPILVSSNRTAGEALSISLAGAQAYLAEGWAGFSVFRLAPNSPPLLEASLATSLRGADVAFVDSLALVAAGESGVVVYGLTNPATPVRLGAYAGARHARAIAIAGSLAGIGDGPSGFKLLDISNPVQPILVGALATTNFNFIDGVVIAGIRAAVSDGQTIHLLDIQDPAAPRGLSRYEAPGFIFDLAEVNGRLIAAAGGAGLLFFDLAQEDSMIPYRQIPTPGPATSLAVADGRIYVALGDRGWRAVDLADPLNPTLNEPGSSSALTEQVAVWNHLAWLGDRQGAVRLVDVAVPLSPIPVASFGPLSRVLKLTAGANMAAVAEDDAGVAFLTVDPNPDRDGDGLPDDWETTWINADGNDALRSLADITPGADLDGDGLTNLQEYLAGTSPVDAASVFAVRIQSPSGTSVVTLRWPSVAGKRYALLRSTNLAQGFVVIQDNLEATPPLNVCTDTLADGEAFYLIEAR
jgi:hypothetical protein